MKKKSDGAARSFTPVRFALLCVAILLSLGLLLGRVAWLQLISPDKLVRQQDMRSLREVTTASPRGMIVDREGHPLAVSVPVDAVWADPKTLLSKGGVGYDARWQALADTLHLSLSTLAERVNHAPTGRFLYLARQVSPQQAQWIDQLNLPGINLREESRRFYPAGHVAANLIGFTNIDGQGIEGIEKSFNAQLMGKPGSRLVRKDKFGHVIENITEVSPVPAHNLQLSIDERLQTVTEDALDNAVTWNKAESGAAILVSIATGEVLAMANYPDFNPNNRDGAVLDDFRNRAISDTFEPGSTVKPLVIMTALQQGIVQPDSVIDTHPFILDGHRIRDVGFYPELTLTGILQKSSDTGVSHLSLAMPVQRLIDTYKNFGFGQPTGLGLTGESRGLMPQRRYWSDLDRATFAFGYGLMVTPLQLAHVYATIGSFGIYRPLSITRIDPPVIGKRVMPEALVRQVEHMMESVALPGGGGTKAAVRGYRVAVKTGTAKKIGDDGKYVDKYVAYTAGVAPASNPQFALVVVINNPQNGSYYGGAVSAPVFSQIMGDVLRLENVKPDGMPPDSSHLLVMDSHKAFAHTL
ncbi:peptidoglycan glycosyltransferase FtsI [Citrobacter rodentium]|uniref:Peptidoglycan D,D-transpeptidase FtsI n=2 Tax=Citrobacter rodentium TaxID=67825 RepID=D2TM39_CITRI|nr:peptidoglycan glycosyltransferase FtsI [Citrobacter rodentium]KIQ49282.1 peptidoglycan synthase [Citrobacter rodentium]QBY28415.1 peptidoglycan glycosyltransferase FtsI [Citrobacter rodentium]UHO29711.1 peptidoglycan glycosyltransferase FtsI [Citrobacter rodentium NBRC 105723 = DSM 16636]CBG88616.1 penicillin-binding protein [Citrobacter rodentium ICC168]HAT8014471.1 peptidoglycan synthase [Citrobacter rodentium NBRC 105723 = DSM 16636]